MGGPRARQEVIIGFLCVLCVSQLLVTVSLGYKLFCKREISKGIRGFSKHSTIWCMSLFCLSTFLDLMHTSMAHRYHEELSSNTIQLRRMQYIADIPYFLASIALYVVIIGKLHISFKGSAYEISRRYTALLALFISLSVFCMIHYIITISGDTKIIFLIQSLKFVYLLLINEIIIDIGVLALFIYKIQQLLVSLVDINVKEIYEEYDHDIYRSSWSRRKSTIQIVEVSSNSNNILHDQKRLLSLITRQTILGCMQLFFNCAFYIKILIDSYIVNNKSSSSEMESNIFIFEGTYLLRGVANLTIICMLYLNFNFNTRLYHNVCGCCHNGCYKCCVCCTRKKLKGKEMDFYQRL